MSQLGKVQEEYQNMVIFESAYWSMQDKIMKAENEQEAFSGNRNHCLSEAFVWIMSVSSMENLGY